MPAGLEADRGGMEARLSRRHMPELVLAGKRAAVQREQIHDDRAGMQVVGGGGGRCTALCLCRLSCAACYSSPPKAVTGHLTVPGRVFVAGLVDSRTISGLC